VWVSAPTWANHKGVFGAAGFKTADYAYYDPATKGLDFARLQEALEQVPAGDVVLLHACCHNPTGVDLTPAQWTTVAEIASRRGWLPFLDFAYQGYGDGLEQDRAGVLALAAVCPEFLVASSFSKNFGLYQDRTGALTVVAGSASVAEAAFSNVEIAIRVNYSNPPAHGGLIVTRILSDAALRRQWMGELTAMREHIAAAAHQVRGRPGPARRGGRLLLYPAPEGHVLLQRPERCAGQVPPRAEEHLHCGRRPHQRGRHHVEEHGVPVPLHPRSAGRGLDVCLPSRIR
jgi:aspartate/tyrosine/aromatic aminotransferase